MTNAHFTGRSGNDKTGEVAGTTISSDSCPDTCRLKYKLDAAGNIELDAAGNPKRGPCYAKHGPISWHWNKIDVRVISNMYSRAPPRLAEKSSQDQI